MTNHDPSPEPPTVSGAVDAPSSLEVIAPPEYAPLTRRIVFISAVAVVIGLCGTLVAEALLHLIGLITHIAYFGTFSPEFVQPSLARFGYWTVLIPIAGAVIVGLMARYGSAAIRGHGIPEVMERVLYGESRISPLVMVLKPVSAAIAIGTGGPFGAEGPIIATGGALGSLFGQVLHVTADERKTLLAAGAAAGMTAIFGTPVASVLLAVELLLFEYRPRSVIPVALASCAAMGLRAANLGSAPVFQMDAIAPPPLSALFVYVILGFAIGLLAVGATRFVYWIEDQYERLPIHWMWWPTIGAAVVGLIGLVAPRTLGVGYDNITGALNGTIVGRALLVLGALKFISWTVYLSSGTSGGTMAPLFTVGAAFGGFAGAQVAHFVPSLGVDPRVAALVGMAAMFAGASQALLASVVMAFEMTRQPLGLLPVLAGSAVAFGVSLLMLRGSIMTERLARRGANVRTEYQADYLDQVPVRTAATMAPVHLAASDPVSRVVAWLDSAELGSRHRGYPVLDAQGQLLGVVTRREFAGLGRDQPGTVGDLVRRAPAVVYDDNTLRQAADHMVREGVGILPVVARDEPRRVVGVLTRGDILSAHAQRLLAEDAVQPAVDFAGPLRKRLRRN